MELVWINLNSMSYFHKIFEACSNSLNTKMFRHQNVQLIDELRTNKGLKYAIFVRTLFTSIYRLNI